MKKFLNVDFDQYHEGMAKLWDALDVDGPQEVDVYTQCAERIKNAPAWHDRPTCPGLWVCGGVVRRVTESDLGRWESFVQFRVYGPIPEDTE